MPDVLLDKHQDGLALVTLNRPDSLNSMGGELVSELSQALAECEEDQAVRCVSVTGAGRGFCAGADMKGFAARAYEAETNPTQIADQDLRADEIDRVAQVVRVQEEISLRLHTMAKPTVALVNGPAAGGGMSIALSCDIRVCSDRARFVPAYARVGLSGDFGGIYFLTKLVGFGRARETYLTGEPIDAQRALELGIANQVYPHEEFLGRGLEYCARLAAGPPTAYAWMKENFVVSETSGARGALAHEARNFTLSVGTRDHMEGVRAYAENRRPRFPGT